MTDGFEVFVHEVIDAITTSPFLIVVAFAPTCIGYASLPVFSVKYVGRIFSKDSFDALSEMRSCGRLGPEIDGTTVERSSSTCSENLGVCDGSCHIPCAFAYCSTSAT